jgi:hypothetical protein
MRASLLGSRLPGWLHSLQAFSLFKIIRPGLERSIDFLLIIEPGWVLIATALVFLSYLLQIGAIFPWIGLAMAFLPFPLRWARQGSLRWRTSFDLPIALLIAGALVGLIVSPDFSLSLGAFQCILAITLFYYSWVNYPRLATLMKCLIPLGLLAVLVTIPFVIDGTGTHHGIALSLLIVAAILTGIAIFSRDTVIKIATGGISLFIYIGMISMTQVSWYRLFSWDSISGRLPRWETTIHLLGRSPFSGLGLGCWALAYHDSKVITPPTSVHNAYLELYANTGILGVLAFTFSLIIFGKLALEIVRSPRKHPWYGFGIGALFACLATLIVGVVESAPIGVPLVGIDTYYYIVSPVPWLLTGFLVSAHRLLSKEANLKVS